MSAAICPSVLVTVMFLLPTVAFAAMEMLAINCVLELNVHEFTVIPTPNPHVGPVRKLLPASVTAKLLCPCVPVFGLALASVGAGNAVCDTISIHV